MGLILRILRMALPLIFFYLIGKILKSFFAAYQYQQTRQNRGTGHSSGYSRNNNNQRQQSYHTSSGSYRDPYEVLKCSRKSSNEEIKKSYRLLIAKYHPDKFVGMKLDDDFVKLASDKFQQIQVAYDEIRKQRGF